MSNEEAITQLEILLTNITGTVGDGKLSPSLIILAGKTIEALERAKSVLGDKDLVKVARCKNCRYRGTGGRIMDWYNAKKEQPEPFVSVLCRMPGEKPFPTVREGYINEDGTWVSGYFKREPGEVTHWAEMPVFPGDDEE